jgi:transposase-like protein
LPAISFRLRLSGTPFGYVRFTLSYRDVEDLLAERGLDVSYETVRRWVLKFGPLFARELRRRRPRPTSRWHLDEMAVTIAGRHFWLWRAVDDEGEVLDLLVQRRRDKAAAMKLMHKLLKKQGFAPDALVTDKLRSYGAVKSEIDCRLTTTRAYARTIGLRIRISRHDDASARCSVSNRQDQPKSSCQFMPRSTTLSTSSAISHPAARSVPSERMLSGRGGLLPRPEPELGLPILVRPNSVRVMVWTSPARHLAQGRAVPRWLSLKQHLKERRPWESLSSICHLSRRVGSIWPSTFFKSIALTLRSGLLSPKRSGATSCWRFRFVAALPGGA